MWGLIKRLRDRPIPYLWDLLTFPVAAIALTSSRRIHPDHKMTLASRVRLAFRMLVNTIAIESASSYRGHLVMALKLLEMSPEVRGDVVECGTWKGASAANLSLVCRIVGRRLRVYDSFQGLPPPPPGDTEARSYRAGDYRGTLDEVRSNIQRHGAIETCELIPGWFDETLPRATGPAVLVWLDVDYESSLESCVRYLWPRLVDGGYMFTDEATSLGYVALFWSERWWASTFDCPPPGLIGSGTGLALGNFYAGPVGELSDHPLQRAGTAAYTRKGQVASWTYEPRSR